MNKLYTYKNQDYQRLKALHSVHNLFEDPEFPATARSIYYTKRVPSSVVWRRPFEICANPQFIVKEASRFDLDQGAVGNCWFIAAVSMITQVPPVFDKVVPIDQSFDRSEYAGIFHFRFWQFGKWYDVVVDDRLPILPDGTLMFCHNKEERNEFWAALLEKAYAKLSWSYEGLEAGQTTDALIDMTGGIEEIFNVKEIAAKDGLWETIKNSLSHNAMVGCSIEADPRRAEARLPNGLVRGHAYAITSVVTVNVRGQLVRLIRCRNPWGNEVEWNGAWSDMDTRWNSIDKRTREQMGVTSQADGEFWISYEDWLREFDHVHICSLAPDSYEDRTANLMRHSKQSWRQLMFDGAWVKGSTAGGCGAHSPARFWTNPQYLIEIRPEALTRSYDDNKCMMIVACLQKHTRQKRVHTGGRPAEEYIQIRIYKVNDETARGMQSGAAKMHLYPRNVARVASSGDYINKREVTCRVLVDPGYYLVVPSTYHFNREGKFLIRVFAEAELRGSCLEGETVEQPNDVYNFNDGLGLDPVYGIKQWWDSLPADERERVMKMAVPALGICCCLMLFRDFIRKFQGQPLLRDDD